MNTNVLSAITSNLTELERYTFLGCGHLDVTVLHSTANLGLHVNGGVSIANCIVCMFGSGQYSV